MKLGGDEVARCSLFYVSLPTGNGQDVLGIVQCSHMSRAWQSVRAKRAGSGIVPPCLSCRGQRRSCCVRGTAWAPQMLLFLLCVQTEHKPEETWEGSCSRWLLEH